MPSISQQCSHADNNKGNPEMLLKRTDRPDDQRQKGEKHSAFEWFLSRRLFLSDSWETLMWYSGTNLIRTGQRFKCVICDLVTQTHLKLLFF